jgi:drug/metabolite transporter (DMT)-like permease
MEAFARTLRYRNGLLAALAFGITAPFGKILLERLSPFLLAALVYLGAGVAMVALPFLRDKLTKATGGPKEPQATEARLSGNDLPFVALMVLLDAVAPILLFVGLMSTSAATAALLGNFEIAATAVIALAIFREAVGARVWVAIALITLGGIILSVEDWGGLVLSPGALCVLCAAVLWGLENNCTRMLSLKDPVRIVAIKGLGSGTVALILAIAFERLRFDLLFGALALLCGFVSIGLSVWFYIRSQRELGAARTSLVYALAPLVGVALSFLILHERPAPSFYLALCLMLLGLFLSATERHAHFHSHEPLNHEHLHSHEGAHHNHPHPNGLRGPHSHSHRHSENPHSHEHLPDLHHIHAHKGEDGDGGDGNEGKGATEVKGTTEGKEAAEGKEVKEEKREKK